MTNLKKISLLIILKIVEVAAIIFIPYFLGKFTILKIIAFDDITTLFIIWFLGFYGLLVIIVIPFIVIAIIFLISKWFKLNSKLINKIIK